MQDLQEFTKNATRGKKPRIEPLPKIRPHKTFVYEAQRLNDPFSRANLARPKPAPSKGESPDLNRRKEPLERYPLDSLRMVGTLSQKQDQWVVLRAPDGTVHRVQEGNFVGQNYGVIVAIKETKTRVREMIQGPNGNWVKREASIAIVK
jgi:type IV pilus assembly protein PilP